MKLKLALAIAAAAICAALAGTSHASTPRHGIAQITAGGKTFTLHAGTNRHTVRTLQASYILTCLLGSQVWYQNGPAPLIGSIQGRTAITCTGGPVSRISMTACIRRDDTYMVCISGTEYGNNSYAIPLAHQCSYTTYGYTWHTTVAVTFWNIFGSSGGGGNTSPAAYTHNCF